MNHYGNPDKHNKCPFKFHVIIMDQTAKKTCQVGHPRLSPPTCGCMVLPLRLLLSLLVPLSTSARLLCPLHPQPFDELF